MLVDPVTIAANSPTPSLVLAMTRTDGYGSERVDTGGNGYGLIIQHTPSKSSLRHYVKLTKSVLATNPYTTLQQLKAASVSLSVTVPDFGFDAVAMAALYRALIDTIDDSEVTIARLLQNQS